MFFWEWYGDITYHLYLYTQILFFFICAIFDKLKTTDISDIINDEVNNTGSFTKQN
jgi:peptidoglycan/LPS O-acetylase OafA/YrhL